MLQHQKEQKEVNKELFFGAVHQHHTKQMSLKIENRIFIFNLKF